MRHLLSPRIGFGQQLIQIAIVIPYEPASRYVSKRTQNGGAEIYEKVLREEMKSTVRTVFLVSVDSHVALFRTLAHRTTPAQLC
jgi:hypothetical protein